jgi:two-component system, OmpR family, phosphate regulon sensor histidine kinase PhoR
MNRKNTTILILMVSSIILLIVLQTLWLTGAYRDALNNFRKESGDLFRGTIVALHDSMIQKNIQHIDGDSALAFRSAKRLKLRQFDAPMEDSLVTYRNFTQMDQRVEVIVQSSRDSITDLLNPIVKRLHEQKRPARFIIRLGPDSIRKDSIRLLYTAKLRASDINLPYSIYGVRTDTMRNFKMIGDPQVRSEWVRVNPAYQYAVAFPEVNSLVIRRITPQIFFSVFLTIITLGAFYVLYKNLLAQQRLMELKNDFISNVTHELKTPVATVSVAIEALRNFNAMDDRKKSAEYLEIAKNELDRLTLMTDKILKTTVFENQGILVENERVDMNTLLLHVLNSLKLLMNNRRIIHSYTKEGDVFTVIGSGAHLTNVLYNLIDNALKYSQDGSKLEITLRERENDVVLSIKDEGIGIPEEYREKIFEKFFRVPTGDVHNVKGYGLGLSYVMSVIKSHNGSIGVESAEGIGSKFIITLPRAL